MIVQCDQCNTRFRLDDSKIKGNSAKVRCSKCKNVFIVRHETAPDTTNLDSLLSELGGPEPTNNEPKAAESQEESLEFDGQPASEDGPESPKEETFSTEAPSLGDEEAFPFSNEPFTDEQETTPEPAEEYEYACDDKTLNIETEAVSSNFANTPHQADEFELESFAPDQPEEYSIDNSNEEIFQFEQQSNFTPPKTEVNPELSEQAADPQDFGEIDFDETLAAEPPTKNQDPVDLTSSIDKQSIPSDTTATIKDTTVHSPSTASVSPEEPLHPPSSSSRREGTPLIPISLIAIAILLVIALAGAGFYLLNEGPAAFNKLGLGFLTKWTGTEIDKGEGVIVRKSGGTFLINKEAGELFVISGEVVNNFKKPRASIQVKAIVYGPNNKAIQQKVSYCGNSLSREQLKTLPMEKIEAAMLNQFGDSLTNLGVQSGETIPFVIVFTNIPKDAGQFGVEVVNSTVASQ